MNQAENRQARDYLLGRVTDAEADVVELRLLSDAAYAAEFNTIVDDITDEYVNGAFQGADLKQVEQYFFRSADRREKLKFAHALKRVESERRPQRRYLRVYLPIAAGLIAAVGIGLFLWRSLNDQSQTNEALIALNAAYRAQRPTESRISGLNYAPYLPTRGAEENVNKLELQRAELTLLNALRERPTPAVHHALGKVYLAKRQFDDAIKQFDEALKGDSNNAAVQSDLGAAWLEKGRGSNPETEPGKGYEAFARSLEHLDRALELNPNLTEALFNRAIVHDQMMLLDKAEADWQEYLRKDSSSGWANDARQNLKTLQERRSRAVNKDAEANFLAAFQEQDSDRAWQVIRRNRASASAGNVIRDKLLDEYLQLSARGDQEQAQKTLEAVTFAGQLEAKQTQDVYTSELAWFYAHASTKQRATLTNARQLMTLGQSYHSQSKPADALARFEEAQRLFTGVGDLWEAQLAELWIGYSHLNASHTAQSVSILAPLAEYFERRDYRWLHMRALHLLSGAEYNLSEYSQAIDHNQRSLAIAKEIDDPQGAFNTLGILIEQYRYIGNYEHSLACIQQSLPLIESCNLSAGQTAQYFSLIASALSSAELYRAAADYQELALQTILKTGQPQTIARAYANLGTIYGSLGKYDQGLQDATRGYEAAKSLSDEDVRKGMMAYTSQRIGDLHRQAGDVSQAIPRYSECLDLYSTLNNYYGLYEVHKSLLLAQLAQGDDAAAGSQLKTTLDFIEQYRAKILEQDNRNHFFGIEQSVYDLAIGFEYSRRNNFEAAFNYSEASRARSLLDLVRSKAQPLTLRDIQREMPDESQIVQYAVLDDKLLIWFISKTTALPFEKPITQAQLQTKVSRYLELILNTSSSDEASNQAAKELFEYLIKPVQSQLDKNKIVYFVPDKALNFLPFGALVSSDSNRFLIQDYSIAISPSSTLFVNSSNLARERTNPDGERVLAVGNPKFNAAEFPNLVDLPAAKREAEEVARFYDLKSVLTDSKPTKLRVEQEMQKANVIHFAAHSVLDPHVPLRSRLILADQSNLEAQDIYGMDLPQAKLVVLSSCESGVGKYYGGEGVMNLARPFLAAKVPLVITSLWPVESGATAELMIDFHKHRKRDNVSTVEALRKAQLDMLSRSDAMAHRPYFWASFVTVGGWANF